MTSHHHHHEQPCCQHEHHHRHHHHEHHHHGMRSQIITLVTTTLLLAGAAFIEHTCSLATWQLLLIYLIPFLLVGRETLHEASEGLLHGDAFNEHFLMSVATLGAMAIGFMPGGETEFAEAVFVMLFFQVGELFEGYAEGQSRKSIEHLMQIRPDTAHVERHGSLLTVDPATVERGEITVVRPGERIAIDGVVEEGSSSLNTMALTGESLPRDVAPGDEVISGCVNLSGVLRVRTTATFGESTVAKIIHLVEHAGDHKSASEAFITRFARIYTPIVVLAAIALAVVPPLFTTTPFVVWLHRALIFLVVSCPCALVISVPLTFFGGIGGASRRGILVKGANYLDALAKVQTVVFDKTGTLTHGQFAVTAVHPDSCDERHLLHLAAHVEHFSTHPISAALRQAYPEEATDGCSVSEVQEVAGHGISACVEGHTVSVGNEKMMKLAGAEYHPCQHHDVGTVIHVAIDGAYAGHIVISDNLKPDSATAIRQLKALGVKRTIMLTGDRHEVAEDVAHHIAIDEFHADLLPADKVAMVEGIHEPFCFVGDGLNDAPVLARADIGIAMGGLGSEAAIEAADVVLMDDQPSKIATAISIARHTIGIARQNVAFAIGIKMAVLVLAALGIATMWMAVFADVGVTVIAVLNAMRALRTQAATATP